MKILIVTVQYYQHEKTLQLIYSALSSIPPAYQPQIVVVDNAYYLEGRVDMGPILAPFLPNVAYIPNKNEGYFPGLNTGIRSVPDLDKYDFIIVCNNDISFSDCFFLELAPYLTLSEDNICLVPNIYGLNGEKQNPQYVNRIPFFKRFILTFIYFLPARLGLKVHNLGYLFFGHGAMRAREATSYDQDGLSKIFLPLGAIFIFSPNTYRNLGGLPEDSFLYGEEMLLRRALINIGGSFKISNYLDVNHAESSTTRELSSFNRWIMQRKAFFQYFLFYFFGK
jgi:GT2 family glycosyltransferase